MSTDLKRQSVCVYLSETKPVAVCLKMNTDLFLFSSSFWASVSLRAQTRHKLLHGLWLLVMTFLFCLFMFPLPLFVCYSLILKLSSSPWFKKWKIIQLLLFFPPFSPLDLADLSSPCETGTEMLNWANTTFKPPLSDHSYFTIKHVVLIVFPNFENIGINILWKKRLHLQICC